MKYSFLLIALFVGVQLQAQRVVDKVIIKMKSEITFPENFNPGGAGGGPDGGGGGMQMPRDVEVNTTVYHKGEQTKLETASDFGNNMTFIDRQNKKTTTLMEMMGKKMGFYSTDADQEAMQKRMDSSRNARRDSLEKMGLSFAKPAEPEITYTEETRTIAGMKCKKAIIKTKGRDNAVTETMVWYSPDFKLADGVSLTGGSGGGGMRAMGMSPQGMDKINGFPMEYEITRQNGMKMHMVVTKVQLDPEIADKTFEIPKGYDIKPMSEAGGPGGNRMMFRQGGGQ